MLALISGVLALAAGSAAATSCDPAGDWLIPNARGYSVKAYPIVDTGAGKFNLTMDIRHGEGDRGGSPRADPMGASLPRPVEGSMPGCVHASMCARTDMRGGRLPRVCRVSEGHGLARASEVVPGLSLARGGPCQRALSVS